MPGGKGPGADTGCPGMVCGGMLLGICPCGGLASSVTSGFSPPIQSLLIYFFGFLQCILTPKLITILAVNIVASLKK